MTKCPCGLSAAYEVCCGAYINGPSTPQTPEALMRSRYTAYSQANIDYIKKTMRGKPLMGFSETNATNWAKQVNWLGLRVIQAYLDSENTNKGYVEFIAQFEENNQPQVIHELSEFECDNGTWFYVDGKTPQKSRKQFKQTISRNAPCPCGSAKKYKNCCLKS